MRRDIESLDKLRNVVEDIDNRLENIEGNGRGRVDLSAPLRGGMPYFFSKYGRWELHPGAEGDLARLGQFFKAVARRDNQTIADMGGKIVLSSKGSAEPRIYEIDAFGTIQKSTLGTPETGDSSGTNASYLVPQTIYESLVLKSDLSVSEVVPRLKNVNMTGRLSRYPVESTVAEFVFVTNEVTDKTEKNPTWTYTDLECETFAFWIGVSDDLMEDTIVDLGSEIRDQAIEDLTIGVIEAGALNMSSPFTGILQSTSVLSSSMTSTSIEDITFDDLKMLIDDFTERRKIRNAVFVMHPTIWNLLLSNQDAQGRYYIELFANMPRQVWGYPVLLADSMRSITEDASGTSFVIFGDLRNSLHGTRVGLEIKYFTETMYAVQDDENFFRARTRQASKIGIPTNFSILKTGV